MAWIAGAAGAVEGGIATIFNSFEQDKRVQALKDIANTPGLNFDALTAGALAGYNQNFDAASALSSRLSTANQAQLNAQQEQALPGTAAARASNLAAITGLFGNDAAWLKGVQRRGAALGLSSGLGASQAGQLATLHLSDQEQMQRTALGTGLLGSLLSGVKLANTPGVQAFLGPSIADQVAIRGQERAQRMAGLTGATMQPTGMELILQHMQQEGASLEGFGFGGGTMGPGGSTPKPSSGGNQWSGGGISSGPGGNIGGWGGT